MVWYGGVEGLLSGRGERRHFSRQLGYLKHLFDYFHMFFSSVNMYLQKKWCVVCVLWSVVPWRFVFGFWSVVCGRFFSVLWFLLDTLQRSRSEHQQYDKPVAVLSKHVSGTETRKQPVKHNTIHP